LFEGGQCVGARDEVIGRGHAERLAPMLSELLDGRAADTILVGVGPGSFTGIRVALAAASGLSIGWGARVRGFSSLALLAASAQSESEVAAAMTGGHGELFVQQFDARLNPTSDLLNLPPPSAAEKVTAEVVVGSGAQALVDARGNGRAIEVWPSARYALALPEQLRNMPAIPVYARAPDARVRSAA
jgi:tRNA threonylcarbamoyl adenosine modification protein YeaZ